MQIYDLKVNALREPMGIDWEKPIFSFSTSGEGIFFVSLFAENERLPEQECVITVFQGASFCFPEPLRPGIRYRWQVSDERNTERSFFETGVLFRTSFITPIAMPQTLPLFFRTFQVPKNMVRARLFLTGSGYYRAFLNGERVGMRYLSSGLRDSKGSLGYGTYDITEHLWQDAENELRIIFYPMENVIFAAQLLMISSNGERWILNTDESWRATESGCRIDAKPHREVWELPDLTRHATRCVRVKSLQPAVCCGETVAGVKKILRPYLSYLPTGEPVLDFGEPVNGLVRFRATMEKGRRIRMFYLQPWLAQIEEESSDITEILPEVQFVSKEGTRLYEPMFSRFSFRYIRVEGARLSELSLVEGVVLE